MRAYVTGVSSGLGKALANYLLNKGCEVIGIGRKNSIDHEKYSFIHCDLSDLDTVTKVNFESDSEGCILINNAGVIGPIRRISDQRSSEVIELMNVNTLAPMLLCQRFLEQIPMDKRSIILNISSGAANRPIPSWATYCASKIAIDRFSETIYLEELEKGRNIRVYSIAPGVVDTDMQKTIRSADPQHFSSLSQFEGLFSKGELQPPEMIARELLDFILREVEGPVVRSVKDLV